MAELAPYQQRVVEEKRELDEKIEKLESFQSSETFASLSWGQRVLLNRQLSYMQGYSNILGERIGAFE